MTHPRHSVSYEYHFHELISVLASPTAEPEYLIECETEKKATYFRLRFYSFQRTLYAEGKAEEAEAIKNKDGAGAIAAREKQNLVKRSKAFEVLLRGSSVLFVGRDSKQSPIASQIAQLAQKATLEHSQLTQQIQSATKHAQENPYTKFLEAETINPADAFVAETADVKPTLERTPQWHLEQTILILKHSPKMTHFTRAVIDPSDQAWFIQELANTPNLPLFTLMADAAGVHIARFEGDEKI